jgi:hypothetical protein
MRNIVAVFLLSSFCSCATAQTFACQFSAVAGLVWEKNNWKEKRFITPKPFFLSTSKLSRSLDESSVGEVLYLKDYANSKVECAGDQLVTCQIKGIGSNLFYGKYLYFSFNSLNGAVTDLLGSVGSSVGDSDLYVAPFVCQKVQS